ncbi:hypothetical protein, partial [Kutzneria sp. 744]|uniref:hypothetical protein n=1 Tax=Kutzneria sp. (strain 744) TaxID=345341 RepID=UPI0005B86227
MGAQLTVTKGGASAQALQQATNSIVAAKPAAVLIPASDPVQYRDQMDQLARLPVGHRRSDLRAVVPAAPPSRPFSSAPR